MLKEWFPDILASLQNTAQFPFPIRMILDTSFVQGYLHRWDNLDLEESDVTYAAYWTCAIGVELIPWLILIYVAAVLLFLSPAQALARAVFVLIGWLLITASYMIFAFFFGFVATTIAIPTKHLALVSTYHAIPLDEFIAVR